MLDHVHQVLTAITAALAIHLQPDCRVINAWPGPGPIGPTPLLAIEALSPDEDTAPADILAHTHPADDHPSVSNLTLDTGHARLNLHANLFVADPHHGRTKRAQITHKLRLFFAPPQIGQPPAALLTLAQDPLHTARVTLEEARNFDTEQQQPREEYRAFFRILARYRLLHALQAPYCRAILLKQRHDSPATPVDDLIGDTP